MLSALTLINHVTVIITVPAADIVIGVEEHPAFHCCGTFFQLFLEEHLVISIRFHFYCTLSYERQ